MGAKHSKETKALVSRTHFSKREINTLRREYEKSSNAGRSTSGLTEAQFKETFRRILHSSPLDDIFLSRLYSAFNTDSKGVNFKEFIEGLSVFMKGSADEKLELSFKLYDIDHAGYITRPGLERAMIQLHSVVAGSTQDETHLIQELVKRIFEDLDVDGDGKLSLEEYKLNSMKEPMIIDFLGQFLADQSDSSANSISSALSVPPSPRSLSTPPSPRFGHFAPPSPRLRDSLYGPAGHALGSGSPAGSFRLSNSHSLLWLNGGFNGSGDLLGKVNEFEGLVAAEEEQKEKEERRKKASVSGSESPRSIDNTTATSIADLPPITVKTENSTSVTTTPTVDIIVSPVVEHQEVEQAKKDEIPTTTATATTGELVAVATTESTVNGNHVEITPAEETKSLKTVETTEPAMTVTAEAVDSLEVAAQQ